MRVCRRGHGRCGHVSSVHGCGHLGLLQDGRSLGLGLGLLLLLGLLRLRLLLSLLGLLLGALVEDGLVDNDAAVGASGGGVGRQHLGVFVGADAASARVAGAGGGVFTGRGATFALDVECLVFAGLSTMQTLGSGSSLGLDPDQRLLGVCARRHSVAADASFACVFDSFDDYHCE